MRDLRVYEVQASQTDYTSAGHEYRRNRRMTVLATGLDEALEATREHMSYVNDIDVHKIVELSHGTELIVADSIVDPAT